VFESPTLSKFLFEVYWEPNDPKGINENPEKIVIAENLF